MRIANLVKDNELGEEDIVPIIFNEGVCNAVSGQSVIWRKIYKE